MGLAFTVVRILPQDHNLHIMKGCMPEGIEDKISLWKDFVKLPFSHKEIFQTTKIGSLEFIHKDFFPAFFYLGINGFHRQKDTKRVSSKQRLKW